MYALVMFLVVVGCLFALFALIGFIRDRLDKNRKALVASERALNKAEATLRRIANGAGNPALEAQIGLDEINVYNEREI